MPAPTTTQRRPNVLWIFGDQHRAQALGCHGDPNVLTPNIDNLAEQGIDCTGAVSGFPLCCPFRGSLLTGRYPHHCVPGHEDQMPPDQPTVATAFNQAGYHTAYFGKWHVDGFQERDGRAAAHIVPPERRGQFQEWCGYENNNAPWDCWVHGGTGEQAFHERLPGFETDALTDRLIGYLERRAQDPDAPFFAALSVQPPHSPNLSPASFRRHHAAQLQLRPNVPPTGSHNDIARRKLAGYYAGIENLDWNIGRVIDALRRLGLARDTHIMFFSDHGDMMGSHGRMAKEVPFAESVDIPMIIASDDVYASQSGQQRLMVNHVDIPVTTLGICGIAKPDGMAGYDFSPAYLRGKGPLDNEPDSAFLQCTRSTGHGPSAGRAWRGIVTKDGWKYACFDDMPWLCFNLNDDPYELANLAHQPRFRHERRRLEERLRQWVADTGDQFTIPTA